VKAKGESNADAGDKANDAIRVNGSDLRVKVVGEGANLGLTQAGRIEFAQAAATSTPTPSTTRPASTAPTTRSTSRS
jgi:glutamate dehydrogenase